MQITNLAINVKIGDLEYAVAANMTQCPGFDVAFSFDGSNR
jgi:hypothetical protein